MRLTVRTLLLLLIALCLALPMASGSSARGVAQAASKPCPNKLVLEACVADTSADKVVLRSVATVDASCPGKAINAHSTVLAAPTACDALAFDMVASSWPSRSPSTPTPPPRS